ncbi:hypothetical protein VNO78_22555 [Psophocarpus tetragonolobus]|uniref:Uncharacterized protein n=1 Tax=Psophocarpus tetragonolobus TaxID=3891 RepID=A0AAN9XBQ2_PSOTE
MKAYGLSSDLLLLGKTLSPGMCDRPLHALMISLQFLISYKVAIVPVVLKVDFALFYTSYTFSFRLSHFASLT